MQPYLFPYLGYFQLIQAVDAFVIFDDVNYINGGWINRNFILAKGEKQLFTLPLQRASQNRLISDIAVGHVSDKLIKTIRHTYSKAPQFSTVFPIVEEILEQNESNLARFLSFQLRLISAYLGISPKWHTSSALKKDNELRGQEKVAAICEELGAETYINPIGGAALYDRDYFAKKGMKLSYLRSKEVSYPQFGKAFTPNLSIIDVLMFNDLERCSELLASFEFV